MEKTITFERNIIPGYREGLCRISFILILISLVYDFFSHTLVSQIGMPVLKFPATDLMYWLLHFLRLPEIITGHPLIAGCFDIALFGSCLLCVLYPGRRAWVVVFFILYLVYFIIFNSYGLFHAHAKAGVLLLSIPFMMKSSRGFSFLWRGLRYYTCYIYGSAFLWKLVRGSWLFGQQGDLILKKNLTAYLYYNPQSVLSKIYFWMIQHPVIPDLLFKTGFLMEGLFIAGFFTRRLDKYLFLLAILLPVGFLLVADTLFFELTFLAITFYSWGQAAHTEAVR